MKNLIYLILISLFASSCSDSDKILDDDDSKSPNPLVKIQVKAKQQTGNIFELIQFDIYSESSFTLLDIYDSYDSLVWTVPEVGRFHLFTDHSFTWRWSQNFFLPSKYKSILLGYKDNKIIQADTTYIDILDDKDFLGLNWKDITESAPHSTGYANVLSDDHELGTYYVFEDNTPSIDLSSFTRKSEDESVFAKRSEKILFNYISSLYTKPTYTTSTNDLLTEKYNQLFKHKKEGAKPLAIWVTDKSNIVLYTFKEDFADYYSFRIHAEPKHN
ncbi:MULTISPECIES: hypothetical protein [unclassified Dysgonomonas]|uniref:hypothetical protein n=1 Tax=unclassified Dysgonomonas TaxID=2630389 RepID=UPI000682CBB1|nr:MULTISPECIES: hypothetical protein [unclassified Dysgonomonas]MBD8346589.1 hypothetical protein [Dysgonomonas sp. HGC4]MBF0574494.1 hypothetical protein [Dysgonomonas sp. GY617]